MKKNLLKGMMTMAFAMFVVTSFAQESTKVLGVSGDTWVRSSDGGKTWGGTATLEMKTDATNKQNFYGLMSFALPETEEGYQVKSATLRLVTNYKKGDSKMCIYPLTSEVTNKTTYNDVADQIVAALEGDPIAEFAMKGNGVNSISDKIAESFFAVDAWTNNIDVTAAVKALPNTTFSFFIAKVLDQAGKSNQIFSSRATDVTNTKVTPNITFKGEDLVPQLAVVYEKTGATGISEISHAEQVASQAVYNLQGVRMNANSLPAGIYVKDGKKFVVK